MLASVSKCLPAAAAENVADKSSENKQKSDGE